MRNQPDLRRLYRSHTNLVFAGVAGGIAEYVMIDPTIIRVLLFLILLMSTGPFGIIVYLILAAIMPQAPITNQPPATPEGSTSAV